MGASGQLDHCGEKTAVRFLNLPDTVTKTSLPVALEGFFHSVTNQHKFLEDAGNWIHDDTRQSLGPPRWPSG